MKNKLSSFIYYLSVLFFIIAFNFSHNPPAGNWYQQWMPFLNNKPISDITFVDSLNGFAVTSTSSQDTNYILKTSNRGDNWDIVYRFFGSLKRIILINQNIGFACGKEYSSVGGFLTKTTNGGINWNKINSATFANYFDDMAVLNEDTIWLVDDNGFNGGVYRTTNGGNNWFLQQSFGGNNPNKVYMYNRNIGFICNDFILRKTTNSGVNWVQISGVSTVNNFSNMYFIDSLVGWKSGGYMQYNDTNMRKTTDGGLNWTKQQLPMGGIIIGSGMQGFANINKDTMWGGGGVVLYPNNQSRGLLYRTTNGGTNWFFQIPDTSINIAGYPYCDFVNKNNGWAYLSTMGIHTTSGGDTTFLLPVNQINSEVPDKFILHQNFPNPFNPKTVIKYELKRQTSNVKITVFDIQGKELITLVNQKQSVTGGAGTYEVDFDASAFSSGIYFYSLFADGKLIDTKKMILVK